MLSANLCKVNKTEREKLEKVFIVRISSNTVRLVWDVLLCLAIYGRSRDAQI